MKLSLTILITLLFTSHGIIAQQIEVSGTGEVLIDDKSKTTYYYEEKAYAKAVDNALDKYFGTAVISDYERLINTEMEGKSVQSHTDYRRQYTNTYSTGIWRQDINRNCKEETDEKGKRWMICEVTGVAEKVEALLPQFIVKTLDGTDISINRTEIFISGERGYIYFKSAVDGYLIIFLDDFKNVQRCFPYNKMNELFFKVEANRDYLLFSPEHADYLSDKTLVDEIEFYTDDVFEYNQFYILFSTKPISPPILNKEKELNDGYSTFKTIDRDAFQQWFFESRMIDKNLQVKKIGVDIKAN